MAYQALDPLYANPPDDLWGQQINDNFNYLASQRPSIRVSFALQNVSDDTATTLTPSYAGTNDLWTGSGVEVPSDATGLYLITINVGSTASTGGNERRYVRLAKNGTDYLATRQGSRALNGTFYSAFSTLAELTTSDALSVVVYQDAGVTMSFYGSLSLSLMAPLA